MEDTRQEQKLSVTEIAERIKEQNAEIEKEMAAQRKMKTADRFGPYRKPTDETIPKYKMIQEKALELALLIEDLCPLSQQKSSALTLLEQCKMSANAAIAIHS